METQGIPRRVQAFSTEREAHHQYLSRELSTSPRTSFPLPILSRSFRRPRSDEWDSFQSQRHQRTPSPPPFENLSNSSPPTATPSEPLYPPSDCMSNVDTDTTFGSSPGASVGSRASLRLPGGISEVLDGASEVEEDDDSLEEMVVQHNTKCLFWPNWGSKKDQLRIARKYQRDTI